jgi:23S rRNA-/tRNA-specific pseudouridylate synthase
VYVDSDILVADKPSGLLSVPGFYRRFSLVAAIAAAYGIDSLEHMPVHRLDEVSILL